MYDKDDSTSPVSEEWSEARRFELAATITSTLKAQLRVYDPLLSLTLRYLIRQLDPMLSCSHFIDKWFSVFYQVLFVLN